MAISYRVIESDSHPSVSDLNEQYKQGYVLINVTCHYDPAYTGPDRIFYSTYFYQGGRRMSGQTR